MKKIVAAAMSMVLALSIFVTGCGTPKDDAVAISIQAESGSATSSGSASADAGSVDVTYANANFFVQFMQVYYDSMYSQYYGSDFWSTKIDASSDATIADQVKEQLLTSIEDLYLLDLHSSEYGVSLTDQEKADIQSAAEQFIKDNSTETNKKLGATEDTVAEYLRLSTIQKKMEKAIIAQGNITVSDEEAACRTFTYVKMQTQTITDASGNAVQMTDDEKQQVQAIAQQLSTDAKAAEADGTGASGDAGSLESLANADGYTTSTYSYASGDTGMDEQVLSAADALSEGEVSDPIVTDDAVYVIRLDSAYDEAASASKKESLLQEKQQEYYQSVIASYEDEAGIQVHKKVWNKIGFDNMYAIKEAEESSDATSSGNALTTSSGSASSTSTSSTTVTSGSTDTDSSSTGTTDGTSGQ